MAIGLTDLALVTIAGLVGAIILFRALTFYRLQRRSDPWEGTQLGAGPTFLFRDKSLVDATPDAMDLLTNRGKHVSEFEAMLHALGPHFPDLRQTIEDGDQAQTIIPHGRGQPLHLCITRDAGKIRLTLQSAREDDSSSIGRVIENDVLMSELALLRDMTDQTPQLIWQEDRDGRLIWANSTYLSFADRLADHEDSAQKARWPNTSIFPDLHQCLGNAGSSRRRLSVPTEKSGPEHWFDVDSIPRADGFLHFATDANAAVRADQERRNFVQTLGKTFAHLNIGLAIFNKRRELAMFNPALLDLTGLSASFLSGRPSVDTVLDRLRETRVLPEPKNYKSWREQFSAVEAGAKDGTYCEVWNLPDGQAYRVTGRPHPDGAFAFLIEDITAEVSLTRRFRSDIETGQAVLDTLPDAIAVFSSAGTLVMSNAAYAQLWDRDPSFGFDQRDLQMEMQTWRNRTTPTRMWSELQAFTHMTSERKPWTDSAILDDGRNITCHANPISGGMTMIRFTFDATKPAIIQKLTMPDAAIRSTGR
ncbi:PAS-domain containing protein [Cognatiyoonia sp. IB215182]|uniref:PAS-domain containing protein n=1 Tax=Cognatiyoonia sp. IB215182 TaxID=3097353 RepID=UPI002A0C238A|nr:PAS-domain containing protein [Cognatiyoonia sp. IB215182]MDX8353222.1 PAS-domain containing protein [Cognatiyoonia sp. IB215182]